MSFVMSHQALMERFSWFQRGVKPLLVSEKIERRAQKKGDLDAWQFRTGENEENCCLI